MQRGDWWYSSTSSGMKEPTGGMTWAEADRSWMKAKGRSVRTVLDSVDLMKTRERSRRRRTVAAAAFFAAASLGLVALMAFAVGSGPGDGQALANADDSHADAQNTADHADVSLAVSGQAAAQDSQPAGLKASATGNGGPGGVNVNGGIDVSNPTKPINTLPPPIDTGGNGGGGNGGGGNDSPVDVGASLGDPLGGSSLLSGGGAIEGLVSVSGQASGQDAGSLIPVSTLPGTGLLPDTSGGNLLDINVSGDPENTDDAVDAGADVNAGDRDASVNDDDLLGNTLGGLLN